MTGRTGLLRFLSVWHLLVLLVALVVVFSLVMPSTFPTAFTFRSMANSRAINAMVALAVMIPLACNQFDLSAASIVGLSQVLTNGLQTQQGLPWPAVVVIVLAMGALVGLVNGLLVTKARINSFITTLGTGTLLLGLNQWYTGGRQIVGALPDGFIQIAAIVPGLGVPLPLLYALVIAALLWVVFDYRPLGRCLYVIGDNPRAAVLSGIPADRYIVLAFVASGVIAAFAGIVLQAQLRVGQSTVGQELLLPAFTGALLGATAIRPGRPNAWGTILAVAVLGVAVAGLSQLGAPFFVEPIFNGAMLILAVGLAAWMARRRETRLAAAEAERRQALANAASADP